MKIFLIRSPTENAEAKGLIVIIKAILIVNHTK